MYYKIKVQSVEDNTKMKVFYIKETDPRIDTECLRVFYQKATPYKVKIIALPKQVTTLKKKYKVWDGMELEKHLRHLVFYTMKSYEINDWVTIATFYGKQPFDIETDFYQGIWYSFFKRPYYTCTNLCSTILELNMLPKISKYGDYYVDNIKLSFSYDGFGHCDLNKFIGTHYERQQEKLYC